MDLQAPCGLTEYDYLFKIVLKSEGGVGRTSFCRRFTEGTFERELMHSNFPFMDFCTHTIQVQGLGTVKLQIWDSAVHERYRALKQTAYRGAHGVLVMFDCTDRDWSFKHVKHFFDEINQHAPLNVQKLLVATKVDLVDRRQVTYQEAKALADSLGVKYIETSAKDDINVTEAMDMIVQDIKDNLAVYNSANYGHLSKTLPTTTDPPNSQASRWCTIL